MSLYEDFKKKQGDTKSGKSLYSKFKEEQNLVKPTIRQRMVGEPVKQKDGTYKATTGVTDALSGLPIVGAFTRLGKTLGETKAYNELDDTTREYLMKTGGTEDVVPDINRSKLSIAADAVEAGVDAATGGISSIYRKGAYQTGKLASKEAIKQLDSKLSPSQIMKLFGMDTAVNTAGGYAFDVAQNANEGKTGVETFKPGIGTAGALLLSSLLGGRSAAQLQDANSATRIAEKQAQKFNIPEAGTPPVGYFKALPERATPPRSPAIELPAPGILKAGEDIRNPKPTILPETPKSPIIKKAESFNSRQDFINSERAAINRSKEINKGKFTKGVISEIPTTTDKQLGKIWDEAHATPKQPGTPPIPRQVIDQPVMQPSPSVNSTLTAKGISEAPSVESIPETPIQPKVNTETPEVKQQRFRKEEETFTKDFPDYEKGTFKKWSSELDNISRDELESVAKGGAKTTPTTVPEGAYLSRMKNIADEEGNIKLINELSDSHVISKGAQTTVSAKMAKEGNASDFLSRVKRAILESKGFNSKKSDKEQTEILNGLRKKLEQISKSKLDDNYIDDIINNILNC